MDDFCLPLLLNGFQQGGSYFPHATLKGADLQGLIASGGEALQLPEEVTATSFRIGHQPRQDPLPLSFKGVFVGAPPAQHAFSPLLLSIQGLESCCRIGDTPLSKNVSYHTTFYSKNVGRCRRDTWSEKRAID